MKRCFWIFGVLVFLFSCNQEKAKEEALYQAVMDIHDEVMPKMGTLRRLSISLKDEAAAIQQDTARSTREKIATIGAMISRLEKANEAMMQWMRDFRPLEEGTPHGELLQYLIEQKRSIDKVKEDMMKAKDEAEKYFLAKKSEFDSTP